MLPDDSLSPLLPLPEDASLSFSYIYIILNSCFCSAGTNGSLGLSDESILISSSIIFVNPSVESLDDPISSLDLSPTEVKSVILMDFLLFFVSLLMSTQLYSNNIWHKIIRIAAFKMTKENFSRYLNNIKV